MLITERLLELSRIDTETDQLMRRREHLPERDQQAEAVAVVADWERVREQMQARLEELTIVIDGADSGAAELTAQRERFEAQLKTVIAPREAEALMHEIETANVQRDEIETKEIEALEEQSDIDDRLTAHLGSEVRVREELAAADASLTNVTNAIDVELADLDEARTAQRAELDDSVLARYDRVRANLGVAVARLVGTRCDGCHLDLSAVEVDDVKDAAASSGIADCPQCGRMLVA